MSRRNAAVRETGGPGSAGDFGDTNSQYGFGLGPTSAKKREARTGARTPQTGDHQPPRIPGTSTTLTPAGGCSTARTSACTS